MVNIYLLQLVTVITIGWRVGHYVKLWEILIQFERKIDQSHRFYYLGLNIFSLKR